MNMRMLTVCIAGLCAFICVAEAQEMKRVEGGALYLTRAGVETHRAEFVFAADCEHVATILNKAEPLMDWHCSTSVADIRMEYEISGFKLDQTVSPGPRLPESLKFSLVLNRGVARGRSALGFPLDFKYTESGSSYLLTNDYPYASGNSFTRAVYLLILESSAGSVEVRDIGRKRNGTGQCVRSER
jgi:hypothetical protein